MATRPASPASQGLPTIPLAILASILLLAIDALHLQLGRINYGDLTAPLLSPENTSFRKTYTHIPPIDNFLTVVLPMFMPIFTWELPELSVFVANFAGQLPTHLALIMVEGTRRGKAGVLTFPLAWLIAMQVLGYGMVMPLYYILDLLFSSYTPSDLQLRNPKILQELVFIPAVIIGYFLPTIAQVVTVAEPFHQIVLALWQPFPVYVVLLIWVLPKVNLQPPTPTQLEKDKKKTNIDGLRNVYYFAFQTGIVFHWSTCVIIPIFRNFIFAPATAEHLSLFNIFVPHGVHWYGPATIAQVSLQFLQWDMYCGGLAGLVWACVLAQRAGAWEMGWRGVGVVAKDVALMGLPCAALMMLWRRDLKVLG